MSVDTIAAVATPPGAGGIGVVRISGPLVPEIARGVFGWVPSPRQALFEGFRGGDGEIIDEGIALFFPAPRSFTGEDVLELQGHGGPVVMDLLLQRCLELGARPARPGEFTERAFLNGKLDLAQAEAVADLIESSTALGARLAVRSLQGAFSRRIDDLIERLIRLRTYIEATLDFPDDEIDVSSEPAVAAHIEELIQHSLGILTDARQGQVIREGLRVVIAGPPNAGKSSILNALSGTDAAIVTDIPGTTRDVLGHDIQIDGLPVRILDTAGIREARDPVEQEGVRRARRALEQADLVLWVYDASSGLTGFPPDGALSGAPVTRVRNKIDLIGERPTVTKTRDGSEVALSALTGEGLDLLRARIKTRAGVDMLTEGAFVARRRHLDALGRGLEDLRGAQGALLDGSGAELAAEHLLAAQQAFGEITGRFTSDDLLGRIFSSFCIGK